MNKEINIYQFGFNIIEAIRQFELMKNTQYGEKLKLQSEEQWWEEFKQYMEDV